MFYLAFFERNCPVRVVVANGGGDQKASRQLGVHCDFVASIEFSNKVSLDVGIHNCVIVDMVFQFLGGLAEIMVALACGEDVDVVAFGNAIVG